MFQDELHIKSNVKIHISHFLLQIQSLFEEFISQVD